MRSFAGVAKRGKQGQNREVRFHLLALLVLTAGCAQEQKLRPAAAPTEPNPWGAETDAPPVVQQEPLVTARPRLSRTITLGQDDYAQSRPAPAQQAQGGNNQTTIVNNNIVVQPPVIYGGYGGYGYGYGGGTLGDGRTGVSAGTRAWAPSGWEGAQRTAPRGQTPHVGGNWAPVQDSGPRPMR